MAEGGSWCGVEQDVTVHSALGKCASRAVYIKEKTIGSVINDDAANNLFA